MRKTRLLVGVVVMSIGLAVGGCNANRIACPDVSGKTKFSLLSPFKKKELTQADQADEGRDYGGRDMDFDKKGLLTKKKVYVPAPKRKRSLLERVGLK